MKLVDIFFQVTIRCLRTREADEILSAAWKIRNSRLRVRLSPSLTREEKLSFPRLTASNSYGLRRETKSYATRKNSWGRLREHRFVYQRARSREPKRAFTWRAKRPAFTCQVTPAAAARRAFFLHIYIYLIRKVPRGTCVIYCHLSFLSWSEASSSIYFIYLWPCSSSSFGGDRAHDVVVERPTSYALRELFYYPGYKPHDFFAVKNLSRSITYATN